MLCHHYLFHRLAQRDIDSFLAWMDRESADSMLQLFTFSQSSKIQLITCIDSHHEAVGLLTLFPAPLTRLRSGDQLSDGEYSLEHLDLHTALEWGIDELANMLSCYMRYLVDELQATAFYWEIYRLDQQLRAAAEKAGFTRVYKEERPFVLYTYAG